MTHRHIFLGLLVVLFLFLVGVLIGPAPARASGTFTVDRVDDPTPIPKACTAASDDCSLRGAVIAANAAGGGTIVLPSGNYVLALAGGLDITSTVTLTGAGADTTIVNGNGLDRVFHVLTSTVTFSGITIEGGSVANYGGGLFNEGGNVTLADSAVVNNTANPPSVADIGGGGVYNTAAGTMTLSGSAVWGNTALGTNVHGGGIYNAGTLTLINTTLSGNQATRSGGGLYNTGTATLSNVTITDNTADSNADGSGDAGGIRTIGTGAVVTIRNSIVAGNFDLSSTIVNPDCNGALTSQGHNLLGIDTGCTFTATVGDQVGTVTSPLDPRLGPLQNNGGPTPTHALLSGSPAIDAGNPATPGSGGNACPATDQRGSVRPMDGDGNGNAVCDIGAYELRVFWVNSTADKPDATSADGICQTTTVGECTLRAAIQQANATSGADTIQLAPGVYTLSLVGANEDFAVTGDLDIRDSLAIVGPGAASTIIDGGGIDRVFQVISPGITVTLSNLTVRNGHATGPGDPNLGSGGGIANNGYLLLTNSAVLSNTADFGGGGVANNGVLILSGSTVLSNTAPLTTTPASGVGGGVANDGALTVTASQISGNSAGSDGGGLVNSGTVTVTATTIRGNTAGDDGGGLRNFALMTVVNSTVISNSAVSFGGGLENGSFNNSLTGTVTIAASTFTGNTSDKSGGGLYNELGTLALTNDTISGNTAKEDGGGLYNYKTPTASDLNNVTLTDNTADGDANNTGDGGGIFNNTGTVSLKNTIVAGNADNSPTTQNPDCSGTLTSQGYNLIQSTAGCTITLTAGDITNSNPLLGPLQNNGGPTLTHALLTGSPAIDAGNPATPGSGGNACAATDQRGGARPVDGDGNGSAICDIGAYEFGAKAYRLYLPIVARNP
jgi:CSLREA domain-containing protein